jgi:hypothetical protein
MKKLFIDLLLKVFIVFFTTSLMSSTAKKTPSTKKSASSTNLYYFSNRKTTHGISLAAVLVNCGGAEGGHKKIEPIPDAIKCEEKIVINIRIGSNGNV